MSVPDVVRRYFDAWNAHNAEAIVATFAPDGAYEDPMTGGPLRGVAIGVYATGLWGTLPDVHFDIVSEDVVPSGAIAQWMMRGMNVGSLAGLPPTGKSVELPGAERLIVSTSTGFAARSAGKWKTQGKRHPAGAEPLCHPVHHTSDHGSGASRTHGA